MTDARTAGKEGIEKDPIVVVTVTIIDQDTLIPTLTRSITSNLEYTIDGLKNLDKLRKVLPDDPIAALYVILTNNFDEYKTRAEAEKFCVTEGLVLGQDRGERTQSRKS